MIRTPKEVAIYYFQSYKHVIRYYPFVQTIQDDFPIHGIQYLQRTASTSDSYARLVTHVNIQAS